MGASIMDTQVLDTAIMQKVNGAHREAFVKKFPNQIEHILRLLCERLQLGLDKRNGVDPSDPTTWNLSCEELSALSVAIHHIHQVSLGL